MIVRAGGLDHPATALLLTQHLADMRASSPPGSVHALDLSALATPDIAFFTAWEGQRLLGCGAVRTLTDGEGEVKSMRTDPDARGRGVGMAILDHIVVHARTAGMTRLLLETGTGPMFDAAHRLYARAGFVPCPAFGTYVATDFNRFLCRTLCGRPSTATATETPCPRSSSSATASRHGTSKTASPDGGTST